MRRPPCACRLCAPPDDPLSPAQWHALVAYVKAGGNTKQAAAELGITPWTIWRHLSDAREAAGVGSTVALLLLYADRLRALTR